MNKRSGWFQAVCITAIVLGSLGVLMGLIGMVSFAARDVLQERMLQGPPVGQGDPELAKQLEIQREMQQEMKKVADRWMVVTLPLMVLDLLVSIGLVAGGIGALRLRSAGRVLLMAACWVAIVVEVVQLAPTILMQQENMDVTAKYMSRIMEASAPKGEPMPTEMGSMITTMTELFGVVMIAVWGLLALIQIVFYAFGVIYLRRDEVRALFEKPITAGMPAG